MFTTHLSEIKTFLNKIILSRKRIFKIFKLSARIIFKRFLNDSSTNFRKTHISIDFFHLI